MPTVPGGGSGDVILLDARSGEFRLSHREGRAGLYVCGITPYDATHLGHANTYVAFDLLHRAWLDAGITVRFAENVTDVDDPLLERAAATGRDWEELAAEQIQLFRDDMTALNVIPPDSLVGVVESVPDVVETIERLQQQGRLYEVDGEFRDVYHPWAGWLPPGMTTSEAVGLFRERGGDPDRVGKRGPLDQMVWRGQRPGEPSWPSPWGHGRPGWHVECAAIAQRHLPDVFTVQGGGSDLAFPHHPMSRELCDDLHEDLPLTHHTGMVGLDGEKMSKSRGNLVFVSVLRADGVPPSVIRLALLEHHCQQDWSWSDGLLRRARERDDVWRRAVERATSPDPAATIERMRRALRCNLDAPAAVAAVDEWCRSEGTDRQGPPSMRDAVNALLGVAW